MANPSMTVEQWKGIISYHPAFRSDVVNQFIQKNRPVIEAWIEGEKIELKMGKDPNVRWYGVRKEQLSTDPNIEYRIAPKVTITVNLSVTQANDLYRVLEENCFNTLGGREARGSIMRSIETELKKMGH